MPRFDTLPLSDAQVKSATGKRAEILREYAQFIESLQEGQAGRLQPAAGETLSAVRRRLGAAAKSLGKTLTIRRTNDQLYFWIESQPVRRRRGRRPASAS